MVGHDAIVPLVMIGAAHKQDTGGGVAAMHVYRGTPMCVHWLGIVLVYVG